MPYVGLGNSAVSGSRFSGLVVNQSFIFNITTSSPATTVTMPTPELNPSSNPYVYNYTIDWGEGSGPLAVTAFDDVNAGMLFADAGTYTVTVTGTCEAFDTNTGDFSMSAALNEIVSWGNIGLKWIQIQFFPGTSIPNDTIGAFSLIKDFGGPNGSTFGGSFAFTSITTYPAGLFDFVTNPTKFDGTFMNFGGGPSDNVPELWTQFPLATGVNCFQGCDNAPNYADAVVAGWAP